MSKPRDSTKIQHEAAEAHYGALDILLFPDGTPGTVQIPVWDGSQWVLAQLVGQTNIDVSYDSDNLLLEIASVDSRIYRTFYGDSIIKATASSTFTADAVIV